MQLVAGNLLLADRDKSFSQSEKLNPENVPVASRQLPDASLRNPLYPIVCIHILLLSLASKNRQL